MDYLEYMDEIYEELVEEFGHEIESDCIHKWYKSHSRLAACRLKMSDPSDKIADIKKGKLMNLDEFKAYVEAQRKTSTQEAISKLTQKKEVKNNG